MRISIVGDIMCEKPLQSEFRRWRKIDDKDIVYDIKQCYGSDFVIGNLETVFAGKKAKYTQDIYSFNTPDAFCKLIKNASIDCVTTANNHCLDRDIPGLKRTLRFLDEHDILHVGTRSKEEEHPYVDIEINGEKIRILSYTYGTNYSLNHIKLEFTDPYVNLLKPNFITEVLPQNVFIRLKEKLLTKELRVKIKKFLRLPYNFVRIDNIHSGDFNNEYLNKIKSEIKCAKNDADLVIAYLHTGGQFNLYPGDYSKKICDFFFKQGVKIVMAAHPHVVQRVERYEDGIVAYSLGNFLISPNSVYLLHENKPEYSIILHIEFNQKSIKFSFSIAKVSYVKHHTCVRDCYVLYNSNITQEEKEKLRDDCKYIYDVVNNCERKEKFEMKKEFFIMECER